MTEMLQFASTLFMTGLIWLVQRVQYPGFHHVDEASFPTFHEEHSRRISTVVGPAMLIELLAAIYLTYAGTTFPLWIQWICLALTLGTWLSTALLQVPAHRRLAQGKSDPWIDRLIRGNWVRTVLWTIKSLILISTHSG